MIIQRLFMGFVNSVMNWLLHSPFQGLVSGKVMLVSVRGRTSGKVYTTPVEYGVDGESVLVISSQYHQWWKNLRDGASCTLLLRGQQREAKAAISTETYTVATMFRAIYPKATEEQIQRTVPGRVAIRFTLDAPAALD